VTPRLFRHVLGIEAKARLTYRAEFWLGALAGFAADFGVAWFLWVSVFATSGKEAIGGRNLDGMIFYYLTVILLAKIIRGNRFENAASQDIYEGTLNRYLLFPAPYLWFKYAQHLGMMAPAILEIALFGGVAALFLDLPPGMDVTLGTFGMALGAIAVGNLLYFLMEFNLRLVAFWADNVWSLEVAMWFCASILGGWMLPLSVFPDWARGVMELLPFRFFFDFPARVLLGEIAAGDWARLMALGAVWCLVFGAIGRLIWHRGQLQYTGVGI
jgi:ABC-2 type transport system permease protein